MELILKGQFIYEGQWTEVEKILAESCFNKIRNMYIDVTNPLIDSFNESWDELHPESDLDKEEYMTLYERFMADKSNKATEHITSMLKLFDLQFYGGFSSFDYDFILFNKKGGTCRIVFYPMDTQNN